MIIKLDKVSKTFNHQLVLAELSLTFTQNQVTVLIGPSGCGKSTLLRLIIGLIQQTTGKIYFDEQEFTPVIANQRRQKIGYITQDGGLFPHLTIRKNVTLMADFLGHDPDLTEQRIKELIELVGLPSHLLALYPAELSGGQRQRVSLMRALLLDPACLLLDEPFGALDPITRHELQLELKRIFSQLNKTVILVTHDMYEAAFFADELLLMRAGQVVQQGTFDKLTRQPAESFVSDFIHLQQLPLPPVSKDVQNALK